MAPPKGKSKAKAKQLRHIGEFSGNTKKLSQMEVKLEEQRSLLKVKEKELNKAKCKLQRKQKKLMSLQQQIASQEANLRIANSNIHSIKTRFVLTAKKVTRRKASPTDIETPHMARTVRRNETFTACSLIHGSTKESTAYGFIDTLTSKFPAKELAKQVLSAKPSFVKELQNETISKKRKEYSKSTKNILRSLNIYYSHSVMGKAKYICIRKANKNDENVPNYVTYRTLADYINDIDIGIIRDVKTDFGQGLEGEESGEGVYRPLIPYVQRILEFYLNVYKKRNDEMKQFTSFPKKSEDSFQFLINFGGDGAPGSGTAFLFSFLNIGQRLMSSRENFLVFGAFCKENCTLVRRYIA